jgi:hypothetical protein
LLGFTGRFLLCPGVKFHTRVWNFIRSSLNLNISSVSSMYVPRCNISYVSMLVRYRHLRPKVHT